ncbi:hypothetical protein SVIO_111900 [Streptomyces violaceusniger]|uniref:Uncharacterized protein n=1 Tax=Streptomyces violaceusniger TaxID=68280 RepID=A0A4D4LQU9_STRVO|nr:hypothetical protein SVIO_111900 [Streptomyces violaceusniger]
MTSKMTNKDFTTGLSALRGVRDDIKAIRKELAQLEADRDKRILALGAYEKAKADRIAPAAGLSVVDVVALVPHLGPQQPAPPSLS